ncbi:DALR anticodon-binding domain-containing protein 3 [Planococcus citri]|uniref:DALR anticodon-binding domain-containing protein 3 n=1 Tax=Planococcus citri TaxID=170843 RepID=UPI0031F7D12A
METDIFSDLQKTLVKQLESIEPFRLSPCVLKTSQRISEGDFVILTNDASAEAARQALDDVTKNSNLPIQSVKIEKNRILVSLDRKETFTRCIQQINSMSSDYGHCSQFSKEEICFICDRETSSDDLTNFRVNYLVEIAKNLTSAIGFDVMENDESDQKLYFTHKSNSSVDRSQYRLVLCGVVKNAETKMKETSITVPEYRRIKNKIMIEEMKDRDKLLLHVTELLTDALLKFNLLHVKINSPVLMNLNPLLEDFDGTAVFIMYNYSRLNAIIHEYEERVQKKCYPPLPSVDSVDFGLLKEEKEWIILFNFLLQFPNVVLNAGKDIKKGQFSPYILYNFLHNMSRTVSSYYRSTKILLYNRPQLLPLIVARMYLIKAVHQVFTNGLNLLGIKPAPAL